MLRQAVLTLLGAGLLGLIGCGGKPYVATVQLSGANEVPPVTTNASGVATATLDGNELTITGTFSALQSNVQVASGTDSAAHIHQGAAGTKGGVVFDLAITTTDQRNGSYTGTKELTREQQEAFKSGLFYVNVHTVNNPTGEIRGQLVPVAND
jgi:hypothetical protein